MSAFDFHEDGDERCSAGEQNLFENEPSFLKYLDPTGDPSFWKEVCVI